MTTLAPRRQSPRRGGDDGRRGEDGFASSARRRPPLAPAPQLQRRELLAALRALRRGDFSIKLRDDVTGLDGQIADTFNELASMMSTFEHELREVSAAVGKDGQASRRVRRLGTAGGWSDCVASINEVLDDLTGHASDLARVASSVAKGELDHAVDLEQTGHGPRRGELLRQARVVQGMVDRLAQVASELTRVAREVGGDGTLGALARVQGASGTWKELTDAVNLMASGMTTQVRAIARVTRAVAEGDLTTTVTVDAKGDLLELKQTTNSMVDQLRHVASEVTRVTRAVGTEGRLGDHAEVPGAAGVWRELTRSVNALAGNLTSQVRAIRDVAAAVTQGDLTRSISVEARGEIAQLKDTVNQMIGSLAETTRVNQDQDWIRTNVARFTRMLQGQRDMLSVTQQVLDELAPLLNAHHGAFYLSERDEEGTRLRLFASYAYQEPRSTAAVWRYGQGLVGQAAVEAKRIVLSKVPADYIQITSALGEALPHAIVVVPVLFEGEVKGVLELASFEAFSGIQLEFLDQMLDSLGGVIATIEATMRTTDLLLQSQRLTAELRFRQSELQHKNAQLEEKALQLTEQKAEGEKKNRQVELARQELEEKAAQLALTSKYKSQFLATMSHELRTPLNSLLILSRQLTENHERNLTDKQLRYAHTIRQAGTDLMALINEILDLAKIESGTMTVEIDRVCLVDLRDYVDQTFRQIAEEKGLSFSVELDDALPASIETDDMRLRQVLRNLLSNALKFTERGRVTLAITRSPCDVIAFSVTDTGIGVAQDKQRLIFEAFQQADGSTSRRYGGTGLGLAISRELAELLGGDLRVDSATGRGSTFTLYLPAVYAPREPRSPRPGVDPVATPPSPRRAPALLDHAPALLLPGNEAVSAAPPPCPPARPIMDDRETLEPDDRVVLIVDHVLSFAVLLLELARASGFKGVIARSGRQALELARSLEPDAIFLDLHVPDLDGWVLLDRLGHDAATRHIPVLVVAPPAAEPRSWRCGAFGFVQDPATGEALAAALASVRELGDRAVKRLLVATDDPAHAQAFGDLLGGIDVELATATTGTRALQLLSEATFDGAVIDVRATGSIGLDVIEQISAAPQPRRFPVFAYVGRGLPAHHRDRLRTLERSARVVEIETMERLLQETTRSLRRAEAHLPARSQRVLRRLASHHPQLVERTVLVVDDDLRNIFALTSLLESLKLNVVFAENGRRALARLEEHASIDIVLMDTMMPEMDGYEALRAIRARPDWEQLPVIALTANAMTGDREKCLEAGASDYITKPVDADHLLSVLRVWLYRE